jgi:glucose-1-phosphate adenylyltransferase
MGIYLFDTQVLIDLLTDNPGFDDFGSDIIPHAIKNYSVCGFDFDGYWRDIGTIRSFYEANLDLTTAASPFDFYDPARPIYTHARFLPGSVVEDSLLKDVLLAEGCRIKKAKITHSVVGLRSNIAAGTVIKDSILMGSDYYTSEQPGLPAIGIGSDCHIEGAIIDKNARLGADVIIRPFPPGTEWNTDTWSVQDGIVVVPKNSLIPSGTRIEPSTARSR